MFRIFWQVWIGAKKDFQNAKKIKKEMVNDEIYEEFWISNISIFFKKKTIVLQNFLIKSGIYTIKQHKNFKNFLKP